MFERIIVTLDGSASSEAALPAAQALARRFGSSLVLLHVIEAGHPSKVHGERHLSKREEAEAYLESIARRLRSEGLGASAHVHDAAVESEGGREASGSRGVAATVSAHEAEFGNDLAVMAAHGRRGLAEVLSGSLPLKVAAAGGAAVLLVPRLKEGREGLEPAYSPAFAPSRILLPLDGQSDHEAVLPAALALARALGIPLRLLGVTPRSAAEAGGAGLAFARIAPALSGASLEYQAEGEGRYLAGLAERLRAEGFAVDWEVLRGRPARRIVAAAEAGDLIALSTHRKLGLDASLDGCVAFGVASAWGGSMLVAPVPRKSGESG
jgi:nucleotide-binding universal stress UspA family protein